MKCPACDQLEDRVIDSRATKEGSAIRRRRECLACGHRFTTYEEIEAGLLFVIKKDGRREPFDRVKLLAGIRRATEKRPVPSQAIEEAVDGLESELRALGLAEVTSVEVGERVMAVLRELDEVAYVRFASVYRHFRDVSQFMDEVQSLRGAGSHSEGAPQQGSRPEGAPQQGSHPEGASPRGAPPKEPDRSEEP